VPLPSHERLKTTFARTIRSRPLLLTLVGSLVITSVLGVLGFHALTSRVQLSLDGKTNTVYAMSNTVGALLKAEGIDLSEHDLVAPDVEARVDDGMEVAVRFGRKLTLEVDGKTQTHWVHATDVDEALAEMERPMRVLTCLRIVTTRSRVVA
jgi:resuscitation-promoting factor RpfB